MKRPTTDADHDEAIGSRGSGAQMKTIEAKKLPELQVTVDPVFRKKHGRVHPVSVENYVPDVLLKLPELHDKSVYCGLTDESKYSEYAWAFLRRNCFYQRLIDRKNPNLTIESWEYAKVLEQESPVGLVHLKHYKEGHSSGTPVEWWGVHTFAERLKRATPTAKSLHKSEIEWPKTQVALTFDVNSLFGDGTAAIDVQLAMAKKHLHALAAAQGVSFPEKNKSPNKALLRAQLRVIDLMSSKHAPLEISNQEREGSIRQSKKAKKILECWLSISQVASLMPAFDFKKTLSAGNATAQKERAKRVSELAGAAWRNMYMRKFLNWLQFDNWDHLANPSKKAAPAKELKLT